MLSLLLTPARVPRRRDRRVVSGVPARTPGRGHSTARSRCGYTPTHSATRSRRHRQSLRYEQARSALAVHRGAHMSVYEMVSPGVPPTLRQLLIHPAATNSTPSAPARPGRLPTARRLPATTPTATGHRPGPHDHLLERRDLHRRTGGRTVTGHPLHQPCEPGSWRQPGMDDTSFPCQPTCPTPSPAADKMRCSAQELLRCAVPTPQDTV